METDDVKMVAGQAGWTEILPNESVYMISFRDPENKYRMNVYHRTGSVTVQYSDKWGMVGNYKNVTLEGLKEIFSKPEQE